MHGRLFPGADNLLFKSCVLLFLIYAPHQYFTHYGSAYVQLKRHSNFNNMVIVSKVSFFFTPCITGAVAIGPLVGIGPEALRFRCSDLTNLFSYESTKKMLFLARIGANVRNNVPIHIRNLGRKMFSKNIQDLLLRILIDEKDYILR